MKFICLDEYNDNEGESWRWWLQYDGNEEALHELDILLNTFDSDYVSEAYQLEKTLTDEAEVDTLVKHAKSMYFYSDNKVTGKMKTPEFADAEDLYDKLYKGGIRDYFKWDCTGLAW